MDSLVCYLSSKLLTTASIWSRFMHVSHRLTPLGTLTLYCNFFRALMSLTPVYQWQRSLSFLPGSLVTIFFFEVFAIILQYPFRVWYVWLNGGGRGTFFSGLVSAEKTAAGSGREKVRALCLENFFPEKKKTFYRWSLTKTTNKLSQLTVAKYMW